MRFGSVYDIEASEFGYLVFTTHRLTTGPARPAFSKPWTQYYRIFKFFSYYAFISYSATGNIIYDIDCKDFNQRKHSDFQKHTPGLGNDREEYPRTRLQLVVVLFLCASFLLQFKLAILKSYCQERGKTKIHLSHLSSPTYIANKSKK